MKHPFTPEILWRIIGIQAYINYRRDMKRHHGIVRYELYYGENP